MRIAIAGSSGLIGSKLVEYFRGQGHSVTRIVRDRTVTKLGDPIIRWDIQSRTIEVEKLESHDAIINLAGVNLADQLWTEAHKNAISESRVEGTAFLSQTLARLKRPPALFFSASAIGYYGPQSPAVEISEDSPRGQGFLAQVCGMWEKATQAAEAVHTRVINMRLGMVVSSKGGALGKMLPAFRAGCGGKLGSGQQVMSWIALEEIPRIMTHIIQNDSISGPVNFTSPNPVSNAEWTRTLGKVLFRPTFFSVPAGLVKIMFGEMGKELLLEGARVMPKKLLESGYAFAYEGLEDALRRILKEGL